MNWDSTIYAWAAMVESLMELTYSVVNKEVPLLQVRVVVRTKKSKGLGISSLRLLRNRERPRTE